MIYLKTYENFTINNTDEPFYLSKTGLRLYLSQEIVDRFKKDESSDTIYTDINFTYSNTYKMSVYFSKVKMNASNGQKWYYYLCGHSGDYGFGRTYYKDIGKKITRNINKQFIELCYPFCKNIPNFFKLMIDTKTTEAVPFSKVINDNLQPVIDYYIENPPEIINIPEFLNKNDHFMNYFKDIKKQIDWN